jgi:hypothetical protein
VDPVGSSRLRYLAMVAIWKSLQACDLGRYVRGSLCGSRLGHRPLQPLKEKKLCCGNCFQVGQYPGSDIELAS